MIPAPSSVAATVATCVTTANARTCGNLSSLSPSATNAGYASASDMVAATSPTDTAVNAAYVGVTASARSSTAAATRPATTSRCAGQRRAASPHSGRDTTAAARHAHTYEQIGRAHV